MKRLTCLLWIVFCCVACKDTASDESTHFDFGKGKYKQPFVGWLKSEPEILVKSLRYPPFKWVAPDTLVLEAEFDIGFNEESVRSKSSAVLRFVDTLAQPVRGLAFFCDDRPVAGASITMDASDTVHKQVKIRCKVHPKVGEQRVAGHLIACGNELDEINAIPLQHERNAVATWSLEQQYGWPVMLWLLWLLTVILGLVLLFYLIKFMLLGIAYIAKYLGKLIALVKVPKLNVNNKKPMKPAVSNQGNEPSTPCYLCAMEAHLYSDLSVVDKYYILEKIRLELDTLYENDRQTYDKCQKELKKNTWDALEEAWSHRYPKSDVSWGGADGRTCSLNSSHKYYRECADKGFVKCVYDEHGSPDFGGVTYPGSVVDISDLYDSLPIAKIKVRGGSRDSLQEIAQGRMAKNLEQTVREWAKKRNIAYIADRDTSFYAWRNELNLVPHEDTDCRKLRLVYRPAHEAFVHRGGVANAINIKMHFDK